MYQYQNEINAAIAASQDYSAILQRAWNAGFDIEFRLKRPLGPWELVLDNNPIWNTFEFEYRILGTN